MDRADIAELHYITAVANVPSILELGILSHSMAEGIEHTSVASKAIQGTRSGRRVPNARMLHDYANLYFTARNPMLYLRKEIHRMICVVRVSPAVLDLSGVVVTDSNAASNYTRYLAPRELENIDGSLVFAQYWTSNDEIDAFRKKAAKCAEVLVPDRVDPEMITGAYVSCEHTRRALAEIAGSLEITIKPSLFFL